MKRKRIVVICPGRGSYTKETLNYLDKYKKAHHEYIDFLDQKRKALGEPTLSELDGASAFESSVHTKGEHASILIHACSYLDFLNIDTQRYEVVAITGNSMGWYIALALSQALNEEAAFEVVNTMGSMMKDKLIGGQVVYPVVDEEWGSYSERHRKVLEYVEQAKDSSGGEIYISIELGGFLVLGGDRKGLSALMKTLPAEGDYPIKLMNHGAFHTPLLKEVSQRAFQVLPQSLFQAPKVPVVDGRGHIWQPYSTNVEELYQYTLGHQVYEYYDFTKAITVALKEFAPDGLMLLGPGAGLGGVIGQTLVRNDWMGIDRKTSFKERQKEAPVLITH